MLEVLDWINKNPDWEEKLLCEPYCVKSKRDGPFVLLKYEQFRSDFSIPLVRECRGIILDESDGYKPVCVPFFKFGNFNESYIPEIDWSTARTQEKLDGSLMKLWNYKGEWKISSNGEIDARNAQVHSALLTSAPRSNLYTLFSEAWSKTGIDFDNLDPEYTYMFELTSPYNRIVVKHDETSIHHIGTRNNRTLLELDIDIGILKPKTYNLHTIEDCIESAKLLGDDSEGYVVVDKNFNRIKIKSPRYVMLAHLSDGVTTRGSIVEVIKKNEQDEILSYFPEYQNAFDEIQQGIEEFCSRQETDLAELGLKTYSTRKELAAFITKTNCPACLFSIVDGKAATPRDWLLSRPAHKVLEYIGFTHPYF
jgi:hypothetical protein